MNLSRTLVDPMRDPMDYPGIERRHKEDFARFGSKPLSPERQAIIKADAIAYAAFERPDIQKQKDYLVDFGMCVSASQDEVIYMRGYGPQPYIYVIRRGPRPRFRGVGFATRHPEELEILAEATGAEVETGDDLAGGKRVQLRDPGGFAVEVVYREPVLPLEMRPKPQPANTPFEKARRNHALRPPLRPCPVYRLGHFVLMVEDLTESAQWYMRHLGMIPSDVLCADDGTPAAAFMRLDRGAEPADHHTLFLVQGYKADFLHSAYETLDLDAIGQGDQYLMAKGHTHAWGVGRHILGSQIFCYHRDPYGDEIEHYADSDVFDNTVPTQYRNLELGNSYQWGPDIPKDVLPKPTPADIWKIVKGVVTGRLDLGLLRQIKKAAGGRARPWM